MYLESSLTFDPSATTELARMKPTGAFARLGWYLSLGRTGTLVEHEMFTAVAVMQQLHVAVRAIGVGDVVRVAVDDEDVYLDQEGRLDDLDAAMEGFAAQLEGSPRERDFETLRLVLEHRDEELHYFVELTVRRVHAPGEHPIEARVTGLIAGADRDALAPIFADQARYDELVARKRARFTRFVAQLRQSIGRQIPLDSDSEVTSLRIVCADPRSRAAYASGARVGGYHGVDDAFAYTWSWSDLCFEHDVHVRDCTLVDGHGHARATIDEAGIKARSNPIFDTATAFAEVGGNQDPAVDRRDFTSPQRYTVDPDHQVHPFQARVLRDLLSD